MSTEFLRSPDPATGVNFIHTQFVDDKGEVSTTQLSLEFDQRANAALCRLEAGWLQIMLKHNMQRGDEEITEILKTATERGAGFELVDDDRRGIDPTYVHDHMRVLRARADYLQHFADFSALQPIPQ